MATLKSICRLFLCSCLVVLAGCSSGNKGPKLAATDGTITYQGNPVPQATVMFVPENGPLATATTDDKGKFTLSSGGQPGVTVGKVKVSITAFPPGQNPAGADAVAQRPQTPAEMDAYMKKAEEMQKAIASGQSPQSLQPKSLIPEIYGKPETSGLSYTIKPDEANHIDISLK